MPKRRLTESQHKALEALDALMMRVRRLDAELAVQLAAAIDAVEESIRHV